MIGTRFRWAAATLLAGATLSAEVLVQVEPERPGACYPESEPLSFLIRITENGRPLSGVPVRCRIIANDRKEEQIEYTSTGSSRRVELKADFPGFVLVQVSGKDKKGANFYGSGGAAVAPDRIRPCQTMPEEFDEFWKTAREELAKVPAKVRRNRVESGNQAFDLFDVQVDCAGGAPVSGYLAIPRDRSRKYPVEVIYDGQTVRSAPRNLGPGDRIVFSVNSYGVPNGKPQQYYDKRREEEFKSLPYRNWKQPEKQFFRALYQRVMRTQEYVKTLPEWDRRNLYTVGSSLGGAQAIAAAVFDPSVNCVAAWGPVLCELNGEENGRQPGWPKPDGNAEVQKGARLFDTVNFARKIDRNIPCLIFVGFLDQTAPPIGVYAMYNTLPSRDKAIVHFNRGNNWMPQKAWDILRSFQERRQR